MQRDIPRKAMASCAEEAEHGHRRVCEIRRGYQQTLSQMGWTLPWGGLGREVGGLPFIT